MSDSYERCRALYRAARVHESSSQADRRAVRTALAAAVTTGAPAAAAAASAASVVSPSGYVAVAGASFTGAKGVLQVILGGKLLGAAFVGTVLGTTLSATVYLARPTEQPVAVPTVVQSKTSTGQHSNARVAQAAASNPEPEVSEPSPTPTPEPRIQSDELRIGAEPRRIQSRPATTTRDKAPSDSREYSQDRLLQETQALAEVQSALSRKDANLAWTLLQEQDRRFATGQLAQERAAARVFALCVAGRAVAADQARARFLAAYPASPLSERVKKGCEQ